MKKLTIGIPQIVEGIDSEHCRLSAAIECETFKKNLYYEVENKYRDYLCTERSDAFMVGLLYFAMVNGYDMEIKAPVSEKLYYQLTQQYIPTMAKYGTGFFHPIHITAQLDSKRIPNAGAVGASASGGVDSFYSIIKNSGLTTSNFNVSHLLIASVYSAYYDENDTRQRFGKTAEHSQKIADALHLPLVKVYSNEHEFWFKRYIGFGMLRYMGFVYALQKLFTVYNFSSTYEYKDFLLYADDKGSDHCEFFTAQLISNENLTIYSSGSEASRVEKVEYIADNPIVQKLLYVCNGHSENCCTCSKCMRTQLNLYAIGKLDRFKKVFPKEGFDKRKDKYLITALEKREPFETEILNKMKENNMRMPLGVRIAGNLRRWLIWPLRCALKPFAFANKIYFKYIKKKMASNNGTPEDVYNFNNDKDFAANRCDIVY